MRTNYHTHCSLCRHAFGDVKDYVVAAIENGYSILGMSDHGPLLNPPFPRMTIDEFYNDYLPQIEACQKEFEGRIKILKAVEIEYLEGNDNFYKELLEHLDYMVLGCHYYSGKTGYESKSSYCVGTHEDLDEYVDLIEKALSTKMFKILAHPDLFMWGYPIWDSYTEMKCKEILAICKKYDVIVEFNANGLRRGIKTYSDGTVDYAYPNPNFWKLVKETGLKVVISSDSHQPKEVHDWAIEKAHKIVEELQLNLVEEI